MEEVERFGLVAAGTLVQVAEAVISIQVEVSVAEAVILGVAEPQVIGDEISFKSRHIFH